MRGRVAEPRGDASPGDGGLLAGSVGGLRGLGCGRRRPAEVPGPASRTLGGAAGGAAVPEGDRGAGACSGPRQDRPRSGGGSAVGSGPTRVLVPTSTVTGRSVVSRRVRQGNAERRGLLLDAAGVGQDELERRPSGRGSRGSACGPGEGEAGAGWSSRSRAARRPPAGPGSGGGRGRPAGAGPRGSARSSARAARSPGRRRWRAGAASPGRSPRGGGRGRRASSRARADGQFPDQGVDHQVADEVDPGRVRPPHAAGSPGRSARCRAGRRPGRR